MNPSFNRYATDMIKTLITLILLHTLTHASAQSENAKYNKRLADSLGADEYGMKMYVLVILKQGGVEIQDKKKSDSLIYGHLQNIKHLAEIGKLVVAGPLKKNDRHYEGIFILNVRTIEEANSILETDPAIKAKALDTEMFQWYGSAALSLYLPFYENIKKKDF